MTQSLPPLPYAYDALEPWIDQETMTIHHDKHHNAYVEKTNTVLDGLPQLKEMDLGVILTELHHLEVDQKAKTLLRNHGGGHLNHSFFWTIMAPEKSIDQGLVDELHAQWGSLEKFKEEFSSQSIGHFGSGWTWLVRDENKALKLYTLPNQDSPLTLGHTPVLALDLWEHAYYLKYKNLRVEYIKAWWNVLKLLP